MHTITIDQVQKMVEHVAVELDEPVGILGQFGGGKTAGIEQAVERNGWHMCKVLLGQYDSVDLKGTPWDGDIGGGFHATVWRPASTLPFEGNPNFPKDKIIILFLDEITSATIPVMGICYQLTNERRIGEHKLMDNVRIVLAGNREVDKGIVNRMPMPLNNRITWAEAGLDVDTWCNWALQNKIDPVFVAFLQFRKPLICTFDPAKPEKCVATPRTIEKAARYYAATTMPEDIRQAAMAGAVGDGWAAEFWGFVKVWHQIAGLMPSILNDPVKAKLPEETSMQYAVAVAISGEMTPKTTPIYHKYLTRMPPEFVVLAWQLAVKRDVKPGQTSAKGSPLFKTAEFLDVAKRYKAVFSD